MVFLEPIQPAHDSRPTIWRIQREVGAEEVPESIGRILVGTLPFEENQHPEVVTYIWNTTMSMVLITDGIGQPVDEPKPVMVMKTHWVDDGKLIETKALYLRPTSTLVDEFEGGCVECHLFPVTDARLFYDMTARHFAINIEKRPFLSRAKLMKSQLWNWVFRLLVR